jgi:hypothetical protein
MTSKPFAASLLVWLSVALAFPVATVLGAPAPDFHLQAQLLWAGDGAKPPEGKNYKPVEPAVGKKLKDLPLKWKTYFEVSRTNFVVAPETLRKVAVSEKCQLEVKTHGDSSLEVKLIGKGKEVVKRTQSLPEGEILVLGGNAPNDTGWLVILRQVPRK